MKEWQSFLESRKKEVGSEAIDRWTHTLKVVNFDAGNLYLEAEDRFQLYWFEEYLRPFLKKSFINSNGRTIRVHISLKGAVKAIPEPSMPPSQWKQTLDLSPDPLRSNCTFDSYFVGGANELNFKLFQETLYKKTFNPIYLQGPHGVGKTHLLMAACHALKQQGRTYFYVKADRFTQHIVMAIRGAAMPKLREIYREHDVVAIDDIETLTDRSSSQEELFHTFNALHLAGKTILLASIYPPSHLKGIESRLTSRFEWGVVFSFEYLLPEELAAYFEKLLHQRKMTLEPEIIQYCLSLFSSIPFLHRAVDILQLRMKEAKPTQLLIQNWLASLIQEQAKKMVTTDAILTAVAKYFAITPKDLEGKSQMQEHVVPRHIAMYLCRTQLRLSYKKIGKLFSRDHSTVMASVKRIDLEVKKTTPLHPMVAAILQELKQREMA